MRARVLLAVPLVLLAACATSGNVRNLSKKEENVMAATHARLKQNKDSVNQSLDDLADNLATGLADQHSLSLSISKARLLESMKSPWVRPHPDLAATQKEVAFYHLFALAEAERELLDARLRQRRGAIQEVKKAYAALLTSMAALIEGQKQLLTHLNQPANTRISIVVNHLLEEAKAFREVLEASDNPRLRELAADVAKAEDRVAKSREQVNKALELILKQKEDK